MTGTINLLELNHAELTALLDGLGPTPLPRRPAPRLALCQVRDERR